MSFDIDVFLKALVSIRFLEGAAIAMAVAILAQILGIAVGFLLALGQKHNFKPVRAFVWMYVWGFRALPQLLILLIVWNALPQFVPALREAWFTPFIAAVVALGFTEGAYMSEIIRSALMGVDSGQFEAGRALGLTPVQSFRKVVLQQVIRIALPPVGNNFLNMIKYTSLASVISLQELLTRAQISVSSTFRYAEYYAVAAIYYLVIVSILTILQQQLEKKYQWSSITRKPKGKRPESSR